ncbi:MAG: TIGR03790 family protein [Armatimonadota bacterium]|nr:TIGR03790 family protein [bacterium]MCS7308812.1 TIGR03790 family protein [Armatimonadota bacterium]MDW8103756.1 TIGR03790 family protein [Armatimonadota bacterium]MDW8290587.1 TIGR03790 family protein [Armatimonadota bacterium]
MQPLANPPGRRVAVVANGTVPASERLARQYCRDRAVPEEQLILLRCTSSESIPEGDYLTDIQAPVRRALRERQLVDKVDYLLLVKGVPIKTAQRGFSVDSLLMCMNLTLSPRSRNPYFGKQEPFSSARYGGLYLVARLDGYTFADANALLERALKARRADGLFLLDISPSHQRSGYAAVNEAMRRAAQALRRKRLRVMLDESGEFIGGQKGLMGYYSWGSNDPKYKRELYTSNTFLPGAIAETAVSTSARTFLPTDQGQSLIADLIKTGVTGVKGYVSEPYADALCHADILFDRYTDGYTLVESFWMATPYLFWKDMVVGDPLCAPYA